MTCCVCALFQKAALFSARPCTAREDSPASAKSSDRCFLQHSAQHACHQWDAPHALQYQPHSSLT
jgi:hypothetical protein